MNKRLPLLLLMVASLTGCAKTRLLYDENAYNYVEFDRNYYTEWEGIDKLKITNTTTHTFSDIKAVTKSETELRNGYTWGGTKEKQFGYKYNLSSIEKKFSYGVTSKLFDGRVVCDSLYQKSRVQIDKSGFAMYFPKELVSTNFLAFSCRGGTSYKDKSLNNPGLKVNIKWTFYIHLTNGTYDRVVYKFIDAQIPADYGITGLVQLGLLNGYKNFNDLKGAVAMSFEWECLDPSFLVIPDLTDNYKDKTKDHLALMLYEVFIGESVWN